LALTIEDGTGVEGAESYASAEDLQDYAAIRGIDLPEEEEQEQLLVKAMDYVESFRDRFKGDWRFGPGYLQWPRLNVWLGSFNIEGIPIELKKAQCQVAIELLTVDPMETQSGAAVTVEQVGPIRTEYAVRADSRPAEPTMPKVDALLEPLLRNFGTLTSVRV
jgi:hypothetical protein